MKRLYLEAYHHREKDQMDLGRLAILEAGRQVGEVARGRYPGGIMANEDPQLHDQAVRQTSAALADPATPAVYEAAFTHAQIRARVDILARAGGKAWNLIEVKSSSGFKEEYLADIAVQLHVAEGAGVPIARARLLHVNNQYVWPGGEYDLGALFTEQDLTAEPVLQLRTDAGELKIVPDLAKSWEVLDEGRTYVFHLHEGVTFHDGTDFDAQAAKWNIDRILDPEVKSWIRPY